MQSSSFRLDERGFAGRTAFRATEPRIARFLENSIDEPRKRVGARRHVIVMTGKHRLENYNGLLRGPIVVVGEFLYATGP